MTHERIRILLVIDVFVLAHRSRFASQDCLNLKTTACRNSLPRQVRGWWLRSRKSGQRAGTRSCRLAYVPVVVGAGVFPPCKTNSISTPKSCS